MTKKVKIVEENDKEKIAEQKTERRGRKKKIKVEEEQEVKIKKKRGRKASSQFYSSVIRRKLPNLLDGINEEVNTEDVEEKILHLNIKDSIVDPVKDTYLNNEIDNLNESKNYEIENLQTCDRWATLGPGVPTSFLEDENNSYKNKFLELVKERNEQDAIISNRISNIRDTESLKIENYIYSKTYQEKEELKKEILKDENNINILTEFVENKEWLKHTNINCWWCCHIFNTVPIGIPTRFKNGQFNLEGIFCSFNCSLAYIKDNHKKYSIDRVYPILKHMYCTLTGKSLLDKITEAPARECLTIFGGSLNIEKFRECGNKDIIYNRVKYPMIILPEHAEKKIIKNNDTLKDNSFSFKKTEIKLDKNLVDEAQIRINKSKEMKTSINSLNKFLGL